MTDLSGVNVMEKDIFDEEAWVWKRKQKTAHRTLIDECSARCW